MIEKVKIWKVQTRTKSKFFIFVCENGIVKSVKFSPPNFSPKLILDWNIYSVLRYFFQAFNIDSVYRHTGTAYKKMNIEKLKEIVSNQ